MAATTKVKGKAAPPPPPLPHGLRHDKGWASRMAVDLTGPDGAAASAVLDQLARATPRPIFRMGLG